MASARRWAGAPCSSRRSRRGSARRGRPTRSASSRTRRARRRSRASRSHASSVTAGRSRSAALRPRRTSTHAYAPLRMGLRAERRHRRADEHPVRRGQHAAARRRERQTASATRHPRCADGADRPTRGRRARRGDRRVSARSAATPWGEVVTDEGRTFCREASDRPGGPTSPLAPRRRGRSSRSRGAAHRARRDRGAGIVGRWPRRDGRRRASWPRCCEAASRAARSQGPPATGGSRAARRRSRSPRSVAGRCDVISSRVQRLSGPVMFTAARTSLLGPKSGKASALAPRSSLPR